MNDARHIPGLTLEQYHARPEWSSSQIRLLPEQPELFHGYHISHEYSREPTAAMDEGTALHDAILGDGTGFAVIPPDALNGQGHRKGKAWSDYSDANAGKVLLTAAEYEPIARMLASIRADSSAMRLLSGKGHTEYTIVWTDQETGIALRARPDRIAIGRNGILLADVKTTRALSMRSFQAEIARYEYHRQAAWYWDAAEALFGNVLGFVFIVVDKTPAHCCYVVQLDPVAIMLGRQQNRAAIRDLARRLKSGDWRLHPPGVQPIDLPPWYYKISSTGEVE